MERLKSSPGTLSKLSLSMRRVVDVDQWGDFAEKNLLDLRKSGPFYGKGSLTSEARKMLLPAWENGNAKETQTAMCSGLVF